MGCVSSVLFPREIRRENAPRKRDDFTHHVVSLTSTTYGVLNLDKNKEEEIEPEKRSSVEAKKSSPSREQPPEIINAWELMEGLEEESSFVLQSKKSSKFGPFLRDGFCRSPLKMLNQVGSPKKVKKIWGKENSPRIRDLKKQSPKLWSSIRATPNSSKSDSFRFDSGVTPPSRRRSLGPLFDPELVASFEKELSEEEEKIKNKKLVSDSTKLRKSHDSILNSYKKKCPPGGENTVILYTTTLRGIRKTFEECNLARAIIESQDVQMFERDISMDSGYKEELKSLMGYKNMKVPLLFVKGRLIGGVDEMVKLEENGKLEILLEGIPPAPPDCGSCGGIRFLMCMECNGSCKVLEEGKIKSRKCSKCNENGLIQCPFCC